MVWQAQGITKDPHDDLQLPQVPLTSWVWARRLNTVITNVNRGLEVAQALNDLYVKGWVDVVPGDNYEAEREPKRELDTDVHWRSLGEMGEWNWRMKWCVKLPAKSVRCSCRCTPHPNPNPNLTLGTPSATGVQPHPLQVG